MIAVLLSSIFFQLVGGESVSWSLFQEDFGFSFHMTPSYQECWMHLGSVEATSAADPLC